jgi:hypothetical protein
MSGVPQGPDESEQSYRLDRLAGFSIIAAFVLSLAMLILGGPIVDLLDGAGLTDLARLASNVRALFWVPFVLGLGIGLPAFAILADRERDRTAAENEDAERDAEGDSEEEAHADDA